MADHQSASSPARNATVMASAGTGKTWLLIARLVRLLLEGARPDAILAITFTRKAAAEMQTRLSEAMLEFASCDNASLELKLETLGVIPTAVYQARARNLYEILLYSENSVKITTFHAFCQDILRRFPLEAGVTPGFELLDKPGLYERMAQDALFSEATLEPKGELADALDALFDHCGMEIADALMEFLRQRGDWWAYTEGKMEPLDFAVETLAKRLKLDPDAYRPADFFQGETADYIREFIALLNKNPTSTNLQYAALLASSLDSGETPEQRFACVKEVFLKNDGMPRQRVSRKAQAKHMGEDGQAHFLTLHNQLCEKIAAIVEQQARIRTLATSKAWFVAGTHLLNHYQRIKAEQRLLDFTDLEWQAHQLLNRSDNAQWIQYKLDQRIDHLLVDEFQDTNPTQWNLILPLLRELASAETERPRSVFLVGDSKQSIYRFRRADPRLLDTANVWLKDKLKAETYYLDVSWRSAPAIIDFVNQLFAEGPLRERLQSFQRHRVQHSELWGRVEVLPLITASPAKAPASGTLRNPLLEPRILDENTRHYQEGCLIAGRIKALFASQMQVGSGENLRPLDYSDIFILLRQRTHAHAFEMALREAGIPYVGANRGALLESLEALDMIALLDTLMTPYDNLSLAQVLRSPLFDCSNDDLMRLAAGGGDGNKPLWIERLAALAPTQEEGTPLRRAHAWLTQWRALAGHIPVHDLLDRIYCEGNVLARYESAFPAHLKTRVRSNLTRFIELALDIDSGRYPSLLHFRARLQELRAYQQEAPDEAPALDAPSCVRIMTIHAAKGLEAPVVFLADAANAQRPARPYHALIDWPSGARRPACLLLTGKKAEQDSISRSLLGEHEAAELREDVNLLYVALTRAKQLLFISGCAPSKGDNTGWYGMIEGRLRKDTGNVMPAMESGCMPHTVIRQRLEPLPPNIGADPRLSQAMALQTENLEITPSQTADGHLRFGAGQGEDGKRRGIAIHRMLERLTTSAQAKQDMLRSLAKELLMESSDPDLLAWWQEACQIIEHPNLRKLFRADYYIAAHNEVPILYRHEKQTVHGIIDRLVINSDELILIDYKTHFTAKPSIAAELAESYREQMHLYTQCVRKLWPGKSVRPVLLFTVCALAYDMNC